MKHTNLREEILQSMEYSKEYTKRKRKVDVITWAILIVQVLVFISIMTSL